MEIKRISLLNEFECSASDCTYNCCRGWRIPVDPAAIIKYTEQKGLFGVFLRLMLVKRDDIYSFRMTGRGCPFWGRDRLCHIQKNHGTEYMPLVCNTFPRRLYNLGFFCEETLYLACPEAVKLLIKHAGQNREFSFKVYEEQPFYEVNTTNDDRKYLDYMISARAELAALIFRPDSDYENHGKEENIIQSNDNKNHGKGENSNQNNSPGCYFDKMNIRTGYSYNSRFILEYGKAAQDICLRQEYERLPMPREFAPTDISGAPVVEITYEDIDRLIRSGFYTDSLKIISPLLYRICVRYNKCSKKKLLRLKSELPQKLKGMGQMFNRYYEYYLWTDFFEIYEDYSFVKHLSYGMYKVCLIWTLLSVYAEKKDALSHDETATLIAAIERQAVNIDFKPSYDF